MRGVTKVLTHLVHTYVHYNSSAVSVKLFLSARCPLVWRFRTLRRRALSCCFTRAAVVPHAKFRSRSCLHKTLTCSADDLHKRESRGGWRHAGLVRRRSPAPLAPGYPLRATEEGGTEEEDDTLELTKGFYSEVRDGPMVPTYDLCALSFSGFQRGFSISPPRMSRSRKSSLLIYCCMYALNILA